MEEKAQQTVLEAELVGIRFGLASHKEISIASVSDCPISHSSQLTNPFLGLPLEIGRCESCGTAEIGKCEGHFGHIELPIPIYHPSHVSDLKKMLSLLCLKCLKLKTIKPAKSSGGVAEKLMSCCGDVSQISIKETKTSDGACFLQLKFPSRGRLRDGFWNFLERYGFRYGDNFTRPLLPREVMEMLKRIPPDARKKLARKGYFPQDGYIMKYLPVPPNCLSVPDVSDGISVMSSDLSISMLKKVLKQVDIINGSRSGPPNFESHEVEARDLQSVVEQYLQVRGTSKSARDVGERFGVHSESNESSTKAWLEKMRTLFIRKGSGFSSRSVITGDANTRVDQIGLPYEIAQRITFEERVNEHNVKFLQQLVDNKLCLTYKDGQSTYSLREGSKGHTFLRPGQVVHRRIMDGDTVFINRPPTTHKHSLQALSVYLHDDHTVKINPLICGPLSADFDGDCIHLFYPQSLSAKAEVMELFTVEKQLLSSHSGNLNLQLTTDSLLSLKTMFKGYFFDKSAAQQLAMFIPQSLPLPAVWKSHGSSPIWTALQMLQTVLPPQFDCIGERYIISKGDMVHIDFSPEIVQAVMNEIVISMFFERGPAAVFKFFNSVQPLLMENLFAEGFSVGLRDFYISRALIERIRWNIRKTSPLLGQLISNYNELVDLQMQKHVRDARRHVEEFILSASCFGDLIDPKSESAMSKVVQQIGFLGLQLSDRGKFYSKTLFEDMADHFDSKYPSDIVDSPSTKHGLIQSCFFLGLDPYEEMAHSISTREIIVRSSRGLSEPGTLFKNLMAILRDVIICYDGTVRNLCSNTIIQFDYSLQAGIKAQSLFPAGEPVGVLAATAMSNPAYKAVLDSSPSSNSAWDMMKEILLCKVNFQNDSNDRRVILYLNDCDCGRRYCPENVSSVVKNHLKKITLQDIANSLLIEYKNQQIVADASLIGHIHLNKEKLHELNVSLEVIYQKCKETLKTFGKKKKIGYHFRRIDVSFSDYCPFEQPCDDEWPASPCVTFFSHDQNDLPIEGNIHRFADIICPVLLGTIIKGDHRISSANIIRVSPDSSSWIRTPSRNERGEFALDVVVEKFAVKQSGDAWRVVLDSCLPVLHLIDTTRSTPYAIKQVQEMLGISCACDQAAQRLSTSVRMVAKGVLKEHLILLANSMTCAGNLVGFNSGGYKALSRSLDIQVPFTEATLFTPRRCFEKAAEKCHTDSLSSVVASCSWGKNVALGTGSRFDLLWNQKEAPANQEENINVYEFLNMVRPGANEKETIPDCLGADVDDLYDENEDWNLSPEHTSGTDKPVFEDSAEFEEYAENGTNGGGNWGAGATAAADTENGWSGWGKKSAEAQPDTSNGWNNPAATQTDAGNSWGAAKSTGADEGNTWSGWGKKSAEAQPEKPENSSGWNIPAASQTVGGNSWGAAKSTGADEGNTWSGWGKKSAEAQPENSENSSGWNIAAASQTVGGNSWGASKGNGADDENGSGWGKKSAEAQPDSSSGWNNAAASQTDAGNSWGAVKSTGEGEGKTSSGWGKKSAEPHNSSSWNKAATSPKDGGNSWGVAKSMIEDEGKGQCGWGKKASEMDYVIPMETETNDSWGANKSKGADGNTAWSRWGKKSGEIEPAVGGSTWGVDNNTGADKGEARSGWGKNAGKTEDQEKVPESSGGWGTTDDAQKDTENSNKDTAWSNWGKKTGETEKAWGADKSAGVESEKSWSSWGKKASEDAVSTQATENVEFSSPANNSGWGKVKSTENSQGWGSRKPDREWKINKNRPPKPVGTPSEETPRLPPMFTATRQRLDLFTSDEQQILSEVEPLMYSIRRIMHKSGYNDGDPLSEADHTYVLDNVFNHHPEKDAKMGPSIDHFVINQHDVFAESKCFYVVSTDGSKRDFSYRKCLENFVKGKYPELAEEFIPKYFTKPRPRTQPPQSPMAEPLQTPLSEQPETNKSETPPADQKCADSEQEPGQ